jgi:hypothetical protein
MRTRVSFSKKCKNTSFWNFLIIESIFQKTWSYFVIKWHSTRIKRSSSSNLNVSTYILPRYQVKFSMPKNLSKRQLFGSVFQNVPNSDKLMLHELASKNTNTIKYNKGLKLVKSRIMLRDIESQWYQFRRWSTNVLIQNLLVPQPNWSNFSSGSFNLINPDLEFYKMLLLTFGSHLKTSRDGTKLKVTSESRRVEPTKPCNQPNVVAGPIRVLVRRNVNRSQKIIPVVNDGSGLDKGQMLLRNYETFWIWRLSPRKNNKKLLAHVWKNTSELKQANCSLLKILHDARN